MNPSYSEGHLISKNSLKKIFSFLKIHEITPYFENNGKQTTEKQQIWGCKVDFFLFLGTKLLVLMGVHADRILIVVKIILDCNKFSTGFDLDFSTSFSRFSYFKTH